MVVLAALCGVLAISILVFIPMLLESSIFRQQLEQWVSRSLGRPVLIEGPVSISVLPAPKLRLSGLHVPAPDGSTVKDLLRIDSLEAQARFGQILHVGLKPSIVAIQGLHLVLEMDREEGDFSSVQSPSKGTRPEGSDIAQPHRTSRLGIGIPFLASLPGTQLGISEADLLWVDQHNQRLAHMRNVSLQLTEPSSDGSQSIKAQGDLQGHGFSMEGSLKTRKEKGSADKIMLLELVCQVGGRLRGSLRGRVQTVEHSPEAHLQVNVEPFPLQPVLLAMGMGSAGGLLKSWNQVSFRGDLLFSKGSFQVQQGELRADELLIRLSMAWAKETYPFLELNLETEELELNISQSRPSASKEKSTTSARGHREHSKARAPSLSQAMFFFPLKGSAKIHRVLLRSQPMEELQASYKFSDGVLELEEIRARLEGGELWGSGFVELDDSQPPYMRLDLSTRSVQVGPLLKRLGNTSFLEGEVSGSWYLEGPWEGDLDRAALNWRGEAELLITEGSINGVDLARISRSLGLGGSKEQKHGTPPRTPFSRLETHLGLADGLLKVSKASMQNQDLKVMAAGQANLWERSLDFRLEPELGSQKEGQQGASLVVPFWVDGGFSHPKFHPDLAGIRKKGEGKLHLSLPSGKDLKETLRNLLKAR